MTSSIGAKNYVVQARKIAINGNYDFLPRLISDVGTLIHRYQKLYPGEQEVQGLAGKQSQLLLQGNLDLVNPNTSKEDTVRIKIKFPKDYPKTKPIVALENVNEQLYDPNPAYLANSLARYDRSPKDSKMYLYLQFFELKSWNIQSDLVKIVGDIERKLSENSPFIKKNNTMRETKIGAILSVNNDSNPTLRSELMKTKHELTELENDYETLLANKDEVTLTLAYNEVLYRELCVKFNEMEYMRNEIGKIVQDSTSKYSLDEGSIDLFLEMTPQSKKLLVGLSERDALQECLQFLKERLKKGAKIADLNDSLKKLFEDFFTNQMTLNQP